MTKVCLGLVFLFISCSQVPNEKKNKESTPVLVVNSGVEMTATNKADYKKIIEALRKFLIKKDKGASNNPYWIKSEKDFFYYPYQIIYKIEENTHNRSLYSPTLLALTRVGKDKVIVKIGWFETIRGVFSNVKIIYNILAIRKGGRFKFKNILAYNIRNWKQVQIGNIHYYYYPQHDFDKNKAQEFSLFNKQMGEFFQTPSLSFSYFLSKNTRQSMHILGYFFSPIMFYQSQIGGRSSVHDKLIFSGNNSEIYKHELIHLYLYNCFSISHGGNGYNRIIEEGVCTYLGGAQGLNYQEHLAKLKKHLQNYEVDIYEKLFNSHYVLDEHTSLLYIGGAFICDMALQKYGKKGLLSLLNSGESTEELIQAIEQLFNIERENFNSWFKTKLTNYKPHKVEL